MILHQKIFCLFNQMGNAFGHFLAIYSRFGYITTNIISILSKCVEDPTCLPFGTI